MALDPVDPLEAARRKAEATYNAAADAYDDVPLAFWDRSGARAVERLHMRAGSRVLDVCCGAGGSALPAARAVGSTGSVLGVDLAGDLLLRARAKAHAEGLGHARFERGDMCALPPAADGGFDDVVCVFGIFFVPDMERQVSLLWDQVRSGGRLAISTWGPNMFAPGYGVWQQAVKRIRPDLHTDFRPWDRLTSPELVVRLYADAGIPGAEAVLERGSQPLRSAEDFWTIARGSGFRWAIDQMGPEAAEAVHREVVGTLAARGVTAVETNVIHAVARKP